VDSAWLLLLTTPPEFVQAIATGAAGVTSVFVQYSALGVIALLALGAVRVLFQREVKAHDLERQRADRLEEELRKLNATVQDKYVTTLTEATHTMSELLDHMRERR
jgi:hypothetical protein